MRRDQNFKMVTFLSAGLKEPIGLKTDLKTLPFININYNCNRAKNLICNYSVRMSENKCGSKSVNRTTHSYNAQANGSSGTIFWTFWPI